MPMKMLIAQDMPKEMESKQKPPNVIARLMGLDALPAQQPLSRGQGNSREGYLHNPTLGKLQPQHLPGQTFIHSGAPSKYWQQENNLPDKRISREMYQSQVYEREQQECKDVYEVRQFSKANKLKPQPLQKGRYSGENLAENKMALVRQKFMEAKCLATDEKLRQSQEFQDALEVLSLNRDLFLKFLQEPNSLFSKQLHDLQSIPPPSQSKRITVLKASKNLAENGSGKQSSASERCSRSVMKSENQIRKQDLGNYPIRKQHQVGANGLDKDKPSRTSFSSSQSSSCERPVVKGDNFSQLTRIVVLKPSLGKAQDIKALVSSPISSPRPHSKDQRFHESATDGTKGSRDIAMDITRQMRESLSFDSMCISDRRDENLLSSALSNGYVGDESSFNKSENEYLEAGNLSDSDVTTPTSRHSWDYMNKYSPYSSSSFSRASGSPESSVSREAKKRLSERWAMMAGGSQEKQQVRRSSSTLGEMLALPEIKKPVRSSEEISDGGLSISSSRSREETSREPTFISNSSKKDEVGEESSPRNLSRSRSVPVSSTIYEKVGLMDEVPEAEETSKLKNGRSFKGKFSSLFFSRNRKSRREKPESSLVGSQGGTMTEDSHGGECVIPETQANSQCVTNGNLNGLLDNVGSSWKASPPSSVWVGIEKEIHSAEGVLSRAKHVTTENPSENQDQPSPVSVLERPFEDDRSTPQCSDKAGSDHQEPQETVLRSLPYDDPDLEAGLRSCPQKPASISLEAEEEEESLLFVRNVLLASGLDHKQFEMDTSRWYSSSQPLDPSLLEKFGEKKEDNNRQHQEAKRRQRRSERRLLFDSVNAAVVEIAGLILDFNPWMRGTQKGAIAENASLAEEVWGRVSRLSSKEAQRCSVEGGLADLVVRKEVVGPVWVEMPGVEMAEIGREIECVLIDELVEDVVSELIGGM